MGKWLCRELQRLIPRRAAEQGNLLLAEGSADHHRGLEEAPQHKTVPQRPGMPTTGTGIRRPDGPEASHALKFKSDQPNQATQGAEAQLPSAPLTD